MKRNSTVAPMKSPMKSTETHLQAGAAATAPLGVRLFRLLARGLFSLFFRVRVEGLGNVPRTPAIVCANHLGWADTFLVLLFFPLEPRIYVLGEQQVKFISGFRTRIIDGLQIMVMLDRSKPVQAVRTMQSVLKRGGSLLIFPEGKLGEQEGALAELQPGAAHMAVLSGVPLVPVGVTGTRELWLRRTLVMRIGTALDPQRVEGGTHARVDALTAELAHSMRALLPGDLQRARTKLLGRWLTKLF